MGIEQFFSSIEVNKITNLQNGFTSKLQKQLKSTHLLIDFNSIIHITSVKVVHDMNYILYHIIIKKFGEKYHYLTKNYNIDSKLTVATLKLIDLNTIILSKVREYTLNILNNFIESDELEHLYIAVDGVPNKTKMLEQKQRRYMGTILTELKHKIFQKHESEFDPIRHEYEVNKISWTKLNISPGTIFMDELNKMLSKRKFMSLAKEICPKLKSYTYSGSNEFGEGEMKIVDHLNNKIITDPITIYSPDSDMTLLCLLMSNKHTKINILRHNQQENNYDIVNISILRKNLCDYVLQSVEAEYDNIIDDIVFMLTVFGNDFLPKIESFNVRYDFTKIIDKYVELIKTHDYIIIDKTLNQTSLTEMFRLLHEEEGSNLQRVYMSNKYQNYNKLKKILGAEHENFTLVINNFLSKLRLFNSNVRKGNVDKKYWLSNEQFIETLIKLTHFHDDPNIFIDDYIKYYVDNNKLPRVHITLQPYAKTIHDQYHKNRLEKVLDNIDSNWKVTKYDEEIFKLDNMLDEYVKKLNAYSLDLGYVSVDHKTYMWHTCPIKKSVEKYYKEFFGVNMDNTGVIVSQYIEGLVWVFKYYYVDHHDASIWFYKFTHAPLLTQIYSYLKSAPKDYISKINLNKYNVSINNFFTPIQHLIYVSPIWLHPEIIDKKYRKYIKKFKYVNINKVVDDIMRKSGPSHIDCRGAMFLNKCHIYDLHIDNDPIKSYDDDMIFMKQFKKN